MAITLSCPSCKNRLKVKDELAGRKVKCPKCKEVTRVPELDESDVKPPPIEEDEAAPPVQKKKKKSVLSADVNMNKWGDALANFDIRRFTAVGWVLLFLSLAAAIGCGFLANGIFDRIVPPDPRYSVYKNYLVPMSIGVTVGGLGTFFGVMGILHLAGVSVIRPKEDDWKND
jgi:predicted Zn finger-like uncharacterized protein